MNKGYFVISDICGYTDFLTESELDHANDILSGLMESITNSVFKPLHISNFQGDAVLMYADASHVILGQTLVHQIETIYFEFTKRLKNMIFNSTCSCNACRNMPKLDLKFFVHYGQYAIQKIHDREELTGTDVILIHRLMKNEVVEKTGMKAYAMFTEAAVRELDIGDHAQGFVDHDEEIEKVGTIRTKIYSLKDALHQDQQREENKVVFNRQKDWIRVEQELPVPPAVAWDYLTNPNLKKEWLQMDSVTASTKNGQYDVGTAYHCVHESGEFKYEIVDWRPFKYLTVFAETAGVTFAQMEILKPTENGSLLTVIVVPRSKNPVQGFMNNRKAKKLTEPMSSLYTQSRKDLAAFIEEHQKSMYADHAAN